MVNCKGSRETVWFYLGTIDVNTSPELDFQTRPGRGAGLIQRALANGEAPVYLVSVLSQDTASPPFGVAVKNSDGNEIASQLPVCGNQAFSPGTQPCRVWVESSKVKFSAQDPATVLRHVYAGFQVGD